MAKKRKPSNSVFGMGTKPIVDRRGLHADERVNFTLSHMTDSQLDALAKEPIQDALHRQARKLRKMRLKSIAQEVSVMSNQQLESLAREAIDDFLHKKAREMSDARRRFAMKEKRVMEKAINAKRNRQLAAMKEAKKRDTPVIGREALSDWWREQT